MKKIKYNSVNFLLFLYLIIIAGGIISCEDDKEPSNSGKVELLSFGPSGAQLGDTISFIGNNLNKVTEIEFEGDAVSQASFIEQTPSLIRVKIPQNVQRGFVYLHTQDGGVVISKTEIDFLVPVTVTAITPGVVRPGGTLTITGTNMNWITGIDFFNKTNNIPMTDSAFISQSSTQIEISVPLIAQTGQLTFHTAGTKPQTIITTEDLTIVLPAITGLSPNPIAGGKQQLTITGTDLDLVTGVLLKGVSDTITTFINQSATQIVIAPPEHTAPGVVTIFPYSLVPVVSPNVLNVVLPVITNLSPNPVAREGQLTIAGTNLELVTGILFKGSADTVKTFVSQSATQIVVTVPGDAAYGPIEAFSAAGVPCLSQDALAYVGDPVQLPPLGLALYEGGAYKNGFAYGWWLSTTPDPNSTEVINIGTTASLKVTFDGNNAWSGAVFTNNGVSVESYSKFEFSVYGGPGTDGQNIQVSLNGGVSLPFTVIEGKWNDFSLSLPDLGSPTTVMQVQFQDMGWNDGPEFVYFDRVGFQ
ncbi:MAG: IPT/TIG domain-containing protein [Tannerella sp.]|jgi:hypothetical protein|nr:IPT/TIG domain-containing protein [Tannerella sp.]